MTTRAPFSHAPTTGTLECRTPTPIAAQRFAAGHISRLGNATQQHEHLGPLDPTRLALRFVAS